MRHRLLRLALAAASAAVVLVVGAGAASTAVKGTITLQAVTGPSCTSAVGICFAGTISGKLKGTVTVTATSIVATADTPTTGVLLVTSHVEITTGDGTLLLKEAAARGTAGAAPDLAGIWTVVGGTGSYAGAGGSLQVTGSETAGTVSASYGGEVG